MKKIISAILISASLIGCSKIPPDVDWLTAEPCSLKLIAYKTSKSSKYWMIEENTNNVFFFHSLGGRRIPTIPLGNSVQSKCLNYQGERITEFESYRTTIVVNPNTGTTVIKVLEGYENFVNTNN